MPSSLSFSEGLKWLLMYFWKASTAFLVVLSYLPLTLDFDIQPSSTRRCCTFFTSALPDFAFTFL